MSIALIVERAEGSPITLEEWARLVAEDATLRIRAEPYLAVNPKTRTTIQIPIGAADAEIKVGDQWLPFLRFEHGRLIAEYQRKFEDPENPERSKIASVARRLGAVIGTDAGDDLLSW